MKTALDFYSEPFFLLILLFFCYRGRSHHATAISLIILEFY